MSAHGMQKRLSRGIRSTIAARELPPRASRHGRPLVGAESPYVKHLRTVREDKHTGELKVEHASRPMTLEEVQAERAKVKRAVDRTGSWGQENKPENMAPKGKGGAKPK